MASLEEVNPRFDPGTTRFDPVTTRFDPGTKPEARENVKSTAASAQEQAAGLADAVKASKYYLDLSAVATINNTQMHPKPTLLSRAPSSHKILPADYHSFFWNLLSWKNPRATGITFAGVIGFIFACRYLPIIRLFLKGLWTVLGVVTLAETAAKYTIGSSVASSVRPRKYYKIPKESLEATLDDAEQFINFFVIEIQRMIFAENIPVTAAAFLTAFISYYLIKLLPAWGFALFGTSVIFLTPLVYVSNKDLIDSQLQHASEVVGEQTTQLKNLTAEHTSKGLESVKQYTGDYTAMASEYIGKSRQKIPPLANSNNTKSGVNNVNAADFPNTADFPNAPKNEFPSAAEHIKPVLYTPDNGETFVASTT